MAYDKVDKELAVLLKKVSDIRGKVATEPKNPTDDDEQKLANNKEYLQAYIAYLKKQIV